MNSSFLKHLLLGIIIGMYVVPRLRAML